MKYWEARLLSQATPALTPAGLAAMTAVPSPTKESKPCF